MPNENTISLLKNILLQEEDIERLERQKKMGQHYVRRLAETRDKKEAEKFLEDSL